MNRITILCEPVTDDISRHRTACEQPTGPVDDTIDCDDGDAAVNPGAAEVCDGIDSDCDALVDDDSSVTGHGTWHIDGVCDGKDVEECDGLDYDGDGECESIADLIALAEEALVTADYTTFTAWMYALEAAI